MLKHVHVKSSLKSPSWCFFDICMLDEEQHQVLHTTFFTSQMKSVQVQPDVEPGNDKTNQILMIASVLATSEPGNHLWQGAITAPAMTAIN